MPNESFTFHSAWLKAISVFDPETQSVLFRAIACRELNMRLPRMTRSQRIIFQSPALQPPQSESSSKACKQFVPPDIEEVESYIRTNGLHVDPVKWWHFYNAKGWRIGNHTMRSWKSSIQTWERNPEMTNNNPKPNQNAAQYKQQSNPAFDAARAGQLAAEKTLHDLFG